MSDEAVKALPCGCQARTHRDFLGRSNYRSAASCQRAEHAIGQTVVMPAVRTPDQNDLTIGSDDSMEDVPRALNGPRHHLSGSDADNRDLVLQRSYGPG